MRLKWLDKVNLGLWDHREPEDMNLLGETKVLAFLINFTKRYFLLEDADCDVRRPQSQRMRSLSLNIGTK